MDKNINVSILFLESSYFTNYNTIFITSGQNLVHIVCVIKQLHD